jgi:hypothetical protein
MRAASPAGRYGFPDEELEVVPTSVKAKVEWSPAYRVTPKMTDVPPTARNAIYALFRDGRLFYVGSTTGTVRGRMMDRILNAYQLGLDLLRGLRGITVRVGTVDGGRASASKLRAVERVLVRNALQPPPPTRADRLRNRDYFRNPFTVTRGGIRVENSGTQLGFLHLPMIVRRAGQQMERELRRLQTLDRGH